MSEAHFFQSLLLRCLGYWPAPLEQMKMIVGNLFAKIRLQSWSWCVNIVLSFY